MIQVTTNRSNLQVAIHVAEGEENILRDFVFLFSSTENYIPILNNGISLSWADFQSSASSFVRICKEKGQELILDDFSRMLIEKFVDLNRYYLDRSVYFDVPEEKIQGILDQSHFKRILTKEQLRDTHKLLNLRHGANFSVPGAGKTTTLLAVHTILRHHLKVEKIFVVAPKNAFISWEEEIESIFGTLYSVRRLHDLSLNSVSKAFLDSDVILVNYEKLRKETNIFVPLFLKLNVHFVLDESHRIKSGTNNLSFKQINMLCDISIRRDILSGTPLPQGFDDIRPQFFFLWRKDVLPSTLDESDENSSKRVNGLIKDFFVRTTKDELGLPDPIIHFCPIQMGPLQTELYELLRSEAYRKISGLTRDQIRYFREIGGLTVRLMQAATNPMLLSSEDEYFHDLLDVPSTSSIWSAIFQYAHYEKAAKFEFLQQYIKEYLAKDLRNKVVVWTYFIKNIKLLEQILKGYNPTSIFGAISTGSDEDLSTREGRIKLFHNDPNCRILIANPQACGEGISLHKVCHHAIYLDRNFNAAYYLQSVDRIHRLGLSKTTATEVTFLVSKGTIDEIITRRLQKKTERMAEVLNDKSLMKLAMDPEDISIDDGLGLDFVDVNEIINHLSSTL